MDISYIDNLSYNTNGVLHRASVVSKVIMTTLVITAVIISNNPTALAITLVLVLLGFLVSSLPLRVLGFTLYAFFFSFIFAFSELGAGWSEVITIILKSVTAASTLLLLITTTPYPQIFGFLQKVLPSVMVDVMLIAYRSFFILLEEIQHRLTAIKVRGNYKAIELIKNLKSIGNIIGHGIIHAWELGENMEHAMFVRGYNGKLPINGSWRVLSVYDVCPLAIGIFAIILAVIV